MTDRERFEKSSTGWYYLFNPAIRIAALLIVDAVVEMAAREWAKDHPAETAKDTLQ